MMVGTEEDFEKYRLTAEVRGENTVQIIQDSSTGVDSVQIWVRKRYLGEGGFGDVWQEAWEDKDGDWHYRAVKICPEQKMRAAKIDYKRELAALAAFSRSECASWFVNLHGWWRESEKLFMVMEYLRLGDLSKYASDGIPEIGVKEIAENVLRGLEVMHRDGLTHRDIKPKNILVVQKRPEFPRWWVKIADFGVSKQVSADSTTALHTFRGSPYYCAPEILGYLEQHHETTTYNSKVDIWSFGCVLFNLASWGNQAFSERDLLKYCCGMVQFNPRELTIHLSEAGKSLIEALLQAEPDKRLTATEALQHPWLASRGDIQSNSAPASQLASRIASGDNFNSFLNSTLSNLDTNQRANSLELTILPTAPGTLKQSVSQRKKEQTTPDVASPLSADETDANILRGATKMSTFHGNPDPKFGPDGLVSEDSEFPAVIDASRSSDKRSIVQDKSQDEKTNLTEWLKMNDSLFEDSGTALHVAAKQGQLEIVKILAQQGADIHATNNNGVTPLHYAAWGGYLEVAQWLVKQEADVHAKDNDGLTPLYYATYGGHLEVAQWLVKQGADIHVTDCNGFTPLHYVARNGQLEVAQWLVKQEADVHVKDNDGLTPLHYAAWYGHLEFARWLIKQDADVHATKYDGVTPLHYAAYGGHLEVARLLLEQGANIRAKDKNGYTPQEVALSKSNIQVANLLSKRKAY